MTVTPTVKVRQGKTLRERREHLWVKKLRRLACFNEIVKKFVSGQGVASVARWCHELNPDGELHDKTAETWRKYLTPVAVRVRNDLKEVKISNVEPPAFKALLVELHKLQAATTGPDPVIKTARPIWSEVKKAVRDLDAETILKYCFLIQQARVHTLLELEEKMNLLMPHGYKEIDVLMKIAAEIRKYEAGEQRVKRNGKLPVEGVTDYRPSPDEPWVSDRRKKFNELDKDERIRLCTCVTDRLMKEDGESFETDLAAGREHGGTAEKASIENSKLSALCSAPR